MKIFLLDLWHDLQAKRLWPVAAVLLLALVAVPVVLSKSSETPPAAPLKTARKAPDPKDLKALASVKLSEADESRGSSLDTFDPSNPFRPPAAIEKRTREGAGGAPSTATSGDAGDGGGSGGTGSTGDGGGSTGGGYTGSTGGGDTGSTGGGDTPTTRVQYRYVIDVTFTANGRTRRIRGLERLDMLPNRVSPLLLFMGVSSNAGNAIFLVDSSLEADGEGKCKPRGDDCAFLHLGAGSLHKFASEDGDSYRLRVDRIRKVKVGSAAAGAAAAAAAAADVEAGAAKPSITQVSPMRTTMGETLTLRGRNFKLRRLRNTILFRGPNGLTAFAKPRRATRTKLVVVVPANVSRLLKMADNVQQPTRLTLRVLADRFSEATPRRLSPVVTGGSVADAGDAEATVDPGTPAAGTPVQ
jgi:hypothetical protein